MTFSEAIAQLGLSDKINKKYLVDISASTSHTFSHAKVEYSHKVCEVPLPAIGLSLVLFAALLLRRNK